MLSGPLRNGQFNYLKSNVSVKERNIRVQPNMSEAKGDNLIETTHFEPDRDVVLNLLISPSDCESSTSCTIRLSRTLAYCFAREVFSGDSDLVSMIFAETAQRGHSESNHYTFPVTYELPLHSRGVPTSLRWIM